MSLNWNKWTICCAFIFCSLPELLLWWWPLSHTFINNRKNTIGPNRKTMRLIVLADLEQVDCVKEWRERARERKEKKAIRLLTNYMDRETISNTRKKKNVFSLFCRWRFFFSLSLFCGCVWLFLLLWSKSLYTRFILCVFFNLHVFFFCVFRFYFFVPSLLVVVCMCINNILLCILACFDHFFSSSSSSGSYLLEFIVSIRSFLPVPKIQKNETKKKNSFSIGTSCTIKSESEIV